MDVESSLREFRSSGGSPSGSSRGSSSATSSSGGGVPFHVVLKKKTRKTRRSGGVDASRVGVAAVGSDGRRLGANDLVLTDYFNNQYVGGRSASGRRRSS